MFFFFFKFDPYIAIIGDIKNSKNIEERGKFQNKLNKIRDVFKIIMIHPLNIIEIELLLHHQLDK